MMEREEKIDYLSLVATYAREREYRDLDGEPRCCLCQAERCRDVLFPCEHKCVCRACLSLIMRQAGAQICPLCSKVVKLILPHDGHEREKYWNWVYEIRPTLPPGFRERFEYAGAYLRQPPDDPSRERRISLVSLRPVVFSADDCSHHALAHVLGVAQT